MKFKSILLMAFVVAAITGTVRSHSPDLRLSQLRKDFALRYLQPDSHFALAKYYRESGRPVQAFFILEYARRYRFNESDFDKAFIAYFGDPMPEPPAEAKPRLRGPRI